MNYKRWPLWIGLALLSYLIGSTPTLAQGGTIVKVVPSTTNVQVGETVVIDVNIENVTNLYGVELRLSFDDNLLEVVDADPAEAGTQVAHGGLLTPDFGINQVYGNNIEYAVTQVAPHEPVNGNGTLVKVTFQGKANGTSAISLNSVLLSDTNGGSIPNTSQNGSIIIGTGGATAEPTPVTPSPVATTPVPTPILTPTPLPTTTPFPTYIPSPDGTDCSRIQGIHIVQRGETLYAIGRAYATHPQAIATCNSLVRPGIVHNGNRLAIPVAPWSPVPAGPVAQRQFTPGTGAPLPQPTPVTCRYTHLVQRGETLTRISLRYGVSIWSIAQSNQIYNLHLIYAGQQLCIP